MTKINKQPTENTSNKRFDGVVTSDAMDKTIVVRVARFKKHPKYGKYQTLHQKFKAHDEDNKFKKGDKVTIESCAPLSKDKSFKVVV